MDVKQVETFLEVMKRGSFTAAAEQLGYAQSTITGHIRQLEEYLSVQLFERTSKINRPTSGAHAFLPYAREFLLVRENALNAMLAESQQMSGEIVVGTSETVCITSLAEPLAAFSSAHPGVNLTIIMIDCTEVSRMLRQNEIDLAFFTGEPLKEEGLETLALRWEPMVLTFQKGRFPSPAALTPEDLRKEHYLVSTRGCVFRTLLERYFFARSSRLPHMMDVGSMQVVKNLCACNLGLAFIPRYAVERELEDGTLESMQLRGVEEKSIATQLVIHCNKVRTPAMKVLVERLDHSLLPRR
ncbi:MAG TPA: LysR family transcriptional regulator [Synergistaceae bacterium]|nr:LysR family transcriptional regulator [Synergistaceae bacterium]HPQ38533.1 LysR family transcriptional regulator [Synergistaceae bacterium]